MEVVSLAASRPYDVDPPGARPIHDGVRALRLQGGNASGVDAFMVGLSYYLPGGRVEEHVADIEKVYLIVEGEMTVTAAGETAVLGPLDSCRLAPGETRSVENRTNSVASMLVILPTGR